ncbi:MAG: Stk1 family PASTA domain-containing Ser/Thr kinase [Oscillospiraceae bacterium]|nr:Stk1 family PASTA domain-containing Ser/Thr kinase [Oscillospiraceae bacterium]
MDQYIGKMLDKRYEILELIGTGGMANVYKAKCHRLNRMVAVKILKSDLAENADFRRRFRDESQAVAQLSHANIMSIYDVSRHGEVEYIVMELLEGITLKQYMERRGQMDWREALHFITQIMRGLNHAHSRGIIHRDIKPQNIMILRDGSVKVADFGIACLASAGQTLTQEALGSVHYISPEQARGDRMDARSDIYSAGVVLYEMLTGRLPFEGDSAVAVAIQHLSSVPLAPRDVNPGIPEALELICMKAMSPNLGKRYGSAEEMLEDLEKFRKNPDVDLEYIRIDLEEKQNEDPTQPIATEKVAAATRAARKKQEERRVEEEKQRTRKLIAVIGGAVAALLLLIFVIIKVITGFGGGKEPETYMVPNVMGKTVEQAEMMTGVKGVFTIEVVGTKVNPSYKPGQIIDQTPAAGAERKTNLVISVYVCAEEEAKKMPQLQGTEYNRAKVQLTNMNMGLVFEKKEEYNDKYEQGMVISTTPAAGEDLKKGNTVLLVVSKGPEKKPIAVPSFLEMTIENAALKAEGLGLKVEEHKYEFNEKPAGTVIGQSIAATTTVEHGTSIVFTVSKGPETVVDPQPEIVSKFVLFSFPPEYTGPQTVVFKQDGNAVGQITLDDIAQHPSITHEFKGEKGVRCIVSVWIGDKEISAQVITFE